jgi:hypothetical protein
MKKIIPALVLLSLICKSCKKEAAPPAPSDSLGTVSVSIDGSIRSFNYNQNNNSTAKATLDTRHPNLYTLTVFGQVSPGFFADYLSITIVSPVPIVAGTYDANATPPNTSLEIWYCPATVPLQACHISGNSGLVTISEINSSSVKGTFSATLSYVDNSGTPRTNTLTNGVFNVGF